MTPATKSHRSKPNGNPAARNNWLTDAPATEGGDIEFALAETSFISERRVPIPEFVIKESDSDDEDVSARNTRALRSLDYAGFELHLKG
jgi:hypothetical protein